MIKLEEIDAFIERIPPAPKILKATLQTLSEGDLPKAAAIAKKDPALSAYLRNLVNKPIYGFRNEVHEVSQIFGILGVSRSQQALYHYMVSLLSPKEWSLFALNANTFADLQAELSVGWQKILQHLQINDKDTESAITLLPASIIVAEALFHAKKDDVALLRSVDDIDLNTILKRLCGMDLFDICQRIATKWEMDPKIAQIIQAASGLKPAADMNADRIGKWMHLLLFFTLSKPLFVDANLNDFINFQIDYVADVYEEFAQVMELA